MARDYLNYDGLNSLLLKISGDSCAQKIFLRESSSSWSGINFGSRLNYR